MPAVTPASERCGREIAGIEALILAGHPDVLGLCQALAELVGGVTNHRAGRHAGINKKPAAAEAGRA